MKELLPTNDIYAQPINQDSDNEKNSYIKYEREKDPKRLSEIMEDIKNSKQISLEYEGQVIQLEYIEIPAKEKAEGEEKVLVIIPGFSFSHVSYDCTAKELAQYMGNCRVICFSPLDSGKSSSLKRSSLKKMNDVYYAAFQKIGIRPEYSEVTVIGHSRSDIIAMELAKSHPEIVKNIVLVNGIAANDKNITALAKDFVKHHILDIAPARFSESLNDDPEAFKNYLRQDVDQIKNFINPIRAVNQLKSVAQRKEVDLEKLLSEIKSNILILSSTDELSDFRQTRKELYEKLPDNIQKQHRIEIDGLHDEISSHPEAFVLKIKSWLESLDTKIVESDKNK